MCWTMRWVVMVMVTVSAESEIKELNQLNQLNHTSRWNLGGSNRQLASCNRPGLVDCGDCKCVEPSTCRWCHGMGGVGGTSGTSPLGGVDGRVSSCGLGLVNCGICRCTERSSCATCDGQGGPAAIISSACLPGLPWITWILVGILRS